MAQCKLCDRSGWFLSLGNNSLCQHCEPFFQLDVRQRGRIIQESQDIIEQSRNLDTKLSRIQLLLDHLRALQKYEERSITTIRPAPSEAIRIYVLRRQQEVAKHAELAHDDAISKAEVGGSGKAKIACLTKGLLKLKDLSQYEPTNLARLTRSLQEQIAKVTMADYLGKARKAEFKGQTKKALEQYYEALYFLKHDDVDDRIQADHIKLLEDQIMKLGGSLNYADPPPAETAKGLPQAGT